MLRSKHYFGIMTGSSFDDGPIEQNNCQQCRYFSVSFCLFGSLSPLDSYYRGGQDIYGEVYRPTHFRRQFGYNQQLPWTANSRLFAYTSFIEAIMNWRERIHHRTNSTSEVSPHYWVRNLSVLYACWWHRIAGGTCTAIDISKSSSLVGKGKKKGSSLTLINLKTSHFFGKPSLSPGGRRKERKIAQKRKKTRSLLLSKVPPRRIDLLI